jgi:hypothetical protein
MAQLLYVLAGRIQHQVQLARVQGREPRGVRADLAKLALPTLPLSVFLRFHRCANAFSVVRMSGS